MSSWEESFPGLVAAKAASPRLLIMARELVSRMEQGGRPWVWKDPALCHFLPFWRTIWDDPLYVIAVRHQVDVATSWQRFADLHGRTPASLTGNLLRWQHMMLSVLRETPSSRACVVAEYETLIGDSRGQARHLAALLDRHCGGQTGQARMAAMAATCDPAL